MSSNHLLEYSTLMIKYSPGGLGALDLIYLCLCLSVWNDPLLVCLFGIRSNEIPLYVGRGFHKHLYCPKCRNSIMANLLHSDENGVFNEFHLITVWKLNLYALIFYPFSLIALRYGVNIFYFFLFHFSVYVIYI